MSTGPDAPLAHAELWELVRDELQRMIVNGDLAPGERLVETALSERFNVSRGPVRSALNDLERMGLVVVSPRRGTRVATLDAGDIDQLYDLTLALERVAARRAATRVGPVEIKRLQDRLKILSTAEAKGELDNAVTADLELHREIVRLAGMARLTRIWGELAEEMRFAIALSQRALPEVPWAERNAAIIQALADGDAERAEAELVAYFERAQAEVREHFEDETAVSGDA
ncbi:MAG: GntR family transcriptional regulator [Solirubrobacterales bacterium]